MNYMANNLHSIYNLIYIAVIILGGITLTLSIILNTKETSKQHRAILFFISSIFLYMLTDFVTYYFLGEAASSTLVFILITLSDTLFCLLVVAWIYAITVIAKTEEAVNLKLLIAISAVYLLGSQILSIYLGRYGSYTIQLDEGIWNIILQIFNGGYDLIMIIIGIRCFAFICRKYKSGAGRNSNLLMTGLFVGYMLWITYWDYNTWFKTDANLLEIYAIDPLILLYAIFNIFLIYYFYKNDPLKISDKQLPPEVAVDTIAEQFGLSEREHEVLGLVNKGMSNKQIAGELFISENTVKRHMSNIFKKTQTKSRHDLIYKISKAH